MGAAALAAPILAPYDPFVQQLALRFQPPSAEHWLGTDELGRDIFARVLFGARLSLLTAVAAVSVAAGFGVPLGLLAGHFGGWTDNVIMRVIDVLLSVPAVLLAMTVIAILGRGATSALIAVGIVGIPAFARITRASVLALREREFVLAAKAAGASHAYLMLRTILPNALPPIVVQAAVTASVAVLLEAALSFLALGAVPPEPSWGGMLSTSKAYFSQAPTYALFPGIALTLTVYSFDALARAAQAWLSGADSAVRWSPT
jgi:ABC-type dipeptide/oligopeptide/nickel transport system permease subunit